jgi:hypothetical protein
MRGTVWATAVVSGLCLLGGQGCQDDPDEPAVELTVDASRATDGTSPDQGAAREPNLDASFGADPAMDAAIALSPGNDAAAPLGDASAQEAAVLTGIDGSTPAQAATKLDLLFVIDNSGSMASEQLKLAQELPRLVQVLSSGDRCAGRESDCKLDDNSTPKRHFRAIDDLHLGVVSSNMGGLESPVGSQPAINSCRGLGDDARLQNSVKVAVEGVIAMRQEFQDYARGEVVLAPLPECAIGDLPKYQQYVVGTSDSAEVASRFGCVARLGVRGCPYEQQLEAMWKAVAPSDATGEDYVFLDETRGQGNADNAGFVRDDAVLAVLHVSDEEDCSITDAGKGLLVQTDAADETYGPVNLRCGLHASRTDLVRTTDRYVRGMLSLKPGHPERVVFGAIVGIPVDSADRSIDELLALPAMQFGEEPNNPGFPRTSCSSAENQGRVDRAYPPRRFLEVAKGFGSSAVLHSICAASYAPAIDGMVSKIAAAL